MPSARLNPQPAPDWVASQLAALNPADLWGAHFHILGAGDSSSGCWINPSLSQWWRPVDHLRKRVILVVAGVNMNSDSVDTRMWSAFKIPNTYAQSIAAQHSGQFEWVASIYPYRADALEQLASAIAGGAVAMKWLPSVMNIDLGLPRLQAIYDALAKAKMPLIGHCGEEKAVPNALR